MLRDEAKRNQAFSDGLTRAEASCYQVQLKKWTGADDWRAARDFMARKWPEEFAQVNKHAATDGQGRDLTPLERQKLISAILEERKALSQEPGT